MSALLSLAVENPKTALSRVSLLREAYSRVRAQTEVLCRPLVTEDYVVQTMPDVSPPKWHLAHTTWFFEQFLLVPHHRDYKVFHPRFHYLFNSYYDSVGDRIERTRRGLISRPTVEEIYKYRHWVDAAMEELLDSPDLHLSASADTSAEALEDLLFQCELGLHHEQQHQELLLTDIKHIFWTNPLRPVYRESGRHLEAVPSASSAPAPQFLSFGPDSSRIAEIGHRGGSFGFDNEFPRHSVVMDEFRLSPRLVTNGEYLEFIEAGGYRQPRHWLSQGWDQVQRQGWAAPQYWERQGGRWWTMTLSGMKPLRDDDPVCHVSYFEADAFARWSGARLPGEAEWEFAASASGADTRSGNFLESGIHHPVSDPLAHSAQKPSQLLGDVWEWTQSPYLPYPGFRPFDGAFSEYNGKFMCNQMVLRGGSCATPRDHIRVTYRNFFQPETRWQFSGFRLACEASPVRSHRSDFT